MNIKAMLVSVFRNLIVVCALPLVMVSCMNDARKDAENKYASGVVLIKNTGYYTVKLDDGLALYFSGFSENGKLENLVADEDSVKGYEFYGTGFFVYRHGFAVGQAARRFPKRAVLPCRMARFAVSIGPYCSAKRRMEQCAAGQDVTEIGTVLKSFYNAPAFGMLSGEV